MTCITRRPSRATVRRLPRLAALVLAGAAPLLPMSAVQAQESPDGEITVWSWNVAANALRSVLPGFNEVYPDVTVTIEDLGNQQVFDRMLAGCAAGGSGLPDVVTVENKEAELFWNRFPDCVTDLTTLGYEDSVAGRFPDFKRAELEVGEKAYAMPWDSGPVMVYYRRDLYETAGVDAADIETWDDFIAAGQKISAAEEGVVMTQADLNGDIEFLLMIAQQNGCALFSDDGASITLASPACAESLDVMKAMWDAGTLTAADWGTKIQSAAAGKVASHMWGGWYEGTLRADMPTEQAGLWGMYRMPAVSAGDARAANSGGSALAIPAAAENPQAAYAFLEYALATPEGQITMMRENGLVPSLTAALDDPYVQEPQPFWGDQAVWVDMLSTLPDINPVSSTAYFGDALEVLKAVQLKYLNGGYDSATAALDDAAGQVAISTGLSVD